jgi:hypothetical protein
VPYRLLDAFRGTFEGHQYQHRNSTLGDFIAMHLSEDLHALHKSKRLEERIDAHQRVVNTSNTQRGVKARRGDGTFGEIIPNTDAVRDPRFDVWRGQIATVEIGVEVKILAKAMIKQIDRVMNDMRNQVDQFRKGGGKPICVGIVGINRSDIYTSYEKDRPWATDGTSHYRHPVQEAADAEARLIAQVASMLDGFLILRFRATNVSPYPFEWDDQKATEMDYGAILTRVVRSYDERFGGANGSHLPTP